MDFLLYVFNSFSPGIITPLSISPSLFFLQHNLHNKITTNRGYNQPYLLSNVILWGAKLTIKGESNEMPFSCNTEHKCTPLLNHPPNKLKNKIY